MDLISAIFVVLQKSTVGDVLTELVKFLSPLWIAFLVGIVVGWSWRPKWVNLGREKLVCSISKPSSPLSNSSFGFGFGLIHSLNSSNVQLRISDDRVDEDKFSVLPDAHSDCHLSELKKEESVAVSREDLEHLCQLVEEKDGGPAWVQMMDRSASNMSYQAWQRDPQTGPPQYRTRTVFEDATPELVRDFFWDDEFRLNWDTMIIYASTLEECPSTGTMVVQWIRKFPLFCSDREYIIGRRIWESGRSYYCVTKGIPYPAVPRQNKPRRVDLFYSSWCIRAVESKRGDGQLTACEVLLFHHEDMGIPWEIAKLGIRQGMWGTVKKIEPALREYQKVRKSGAPLSRCTFMAQINTKINADYLRSLETTTNPSNETLHSTEKPVGINVSKFILIGGALILACSLDRGLLTKTVIFGVARRFARIGRRL